MVEERNKIIKRWDGQRHIIRESGWEKHIVREGEIKE